MMMLMMMMKTKTKMMTTRTIKNIECQSWQTYVKESGVGKTKKTTTTVGTIIPTLISDVTGYLQDFSTDECGYHIYLFARYLFEKENQGSFFSTYVSTPDTWNTILKAYLEELKINRVPYIVNVGNENVDDDGGGGSDANKYATRGHHQSILLTNDARVRRVAEGFLKSANEISKHDEYDTPTEEWNELSTTRGKFYEQLLRQQQIPIKNDDNKVSISFLFYPSSSTDYYNNDNNDRMAWKRKMSPSAINRKQRQQRRRSSSGNSSNSSNFSPRRQLRKLTGNIFSSSGSVNRRRRRNSRHSQRRDKKSTTTKWGKKMIGTVMETDTDKNMVNRLYSPSKILLNKLFPMSMNSVDNVNVELNPSEKFEGMRDQHYLHNMYIPVSGRGDMSIHDYFVNGGFKLRADNPYTYLLAINLKTKFENSSDRQLEQVNYNILQDENANRWKSVNA